MPTPETGDHDILVKVSATALNRADTLQRKGLYPPPPGESSVLGLEIAGTVVSCGTAVSRWKPGDRVCGLLGGGGYAEYASIHEEMAIPVPKGLSFAEAAAIPEVYLTAFQALDWLAELQTGELVLIHAGASGVGTAAIQIAREKGARVWVTASAKKHSVCLELGAEKAIDYKKESFEEIIRNETEGKGVNVIVDFLAAPYFQMNLNSLAPDGRLIMLALMGGIKTESVNLAPILRNRIQVKGSTLRARDLAYKIRLTRDFLAFAGNKFETGNLKPVIDSIFGLSEVREAHQRMEANLNSGKIVLSLENLTA